MGLFEPTKKQLGERSQAHLIARLLEVGYIPSSLLTGIVPAMTWLLRMLRVSSGVSSVRLRG
jgi:hypothetical protein